MSNRLLLALFAIATLCSPRLLCAQFTDPRTYTQAPVGLNQLEFDYGYARSNSSIDTALVVAGANFDLNELTAIYTHDFGVLGHLAWVKAMFPFAYLKGSIAGASISGSATGAGDLGVEFAALLMGGQAISMADFAAYRPTTTLGVSLTVTAPTGEYDADKLLNLGSNRWSFKPEFAVAHPFGSEQQWEADGYINAYFFSDNTAYRGVEILRQDPLPGLEAHVSYTFTPSAWVSLDARYSFRGDTVVDGMDQDDAQQNLTVGSEVSWSANAHHSLTLVLAKAFVHKNAPAFTGAAVKYVYSWGKGYE